jgi:hypothetical protein
MVLQFGLKIVAKARRLKLRTTQSKPMVYVRIL